MKDISCHQLLNIDTISTVIKNNQQDVLERIISCFYSCYKPLFVKWAKITYQHYPADIVEFAVDNSFTDAVLKLKEAAVRNELYKSNASLKTILFHYCKNILLSYLTNEKRLAEKNKKLKVFVLSEMEYNIGETESDIKERRYEDVSKALAKMVAMDRQIIEWRHIYGKSNEEIATLLTISAEAATNRIYRCMQRLRKLVDDFDKENK